jgi:hypothetical protein
LDVCLSRATFQSFVDCQMAIRALFAQKTNDAKDKRDSLKEPTKKPRTSSHEPPLPSWLAGGFAQGHDERFH